MLLVASALVGVVLAVCPSTSNCYYSDCPQGTGPCPTGRSYGPCQNGWWGPYCDRPQGLDSNCYYDDIVFESGKCKTGRSYGPCKNGWWGEYCNRMCPKLAGWGSDYYDDCQFLTGESFKGRSSGPCQPFWWGSKFCEKKCAKLDGTGHCYYNDCYYDTGECPTGRSYGPCEDGSYGLSCQKPCAHNTPTSSYIGCFADNRVVPDLPDRQDGNWKPIDCITKCLELDYAFAALQNGGACWCGNEYGKYGQRNESECNVDCIADGYALCGGLDRNHVYKLTPTLGNCYYNDCQFTTGLCQVGRSSAACRTGWWGSLCEKRCGKRLGTSKCGYDDCYQDTGYCPTGRSSAACQQGFFEPKLCNKSCLASTNCYYSSCVLETGLCSTCKSGWVGSYCDLTTECPQGMWGSACDKACEPSYYCESSKCDKVTGLCPHGCLNGFWGPNCESQCPTNQGLAHCDDDYCLKSTGGCPGLCSKGWWGRDFCDQACPSSQHCRDDWCLKDTGACPAPGLCADGWWGPKCDQPCQSNCEEAGCRQSDGGCAFRCKNGWWGPKCTIQCDPLFLCDTEGKGSCSKLDGSCPYGCQVGWWGPNCDQNCSSPGCALGTCNKRTGECLHGCLEGLWGPQCTNTCPSLDAVGHCIVQNCPLSNCLRNLCNAPVGDQCTFGCQGPRNVARDSKVATSSCFSASRCSAQLIDGVSDFSYNNVDWLTAKYQQKNAWASFDLNTSVPIATVVLFQQNEFSMPQSRDAQMVSIQWSDNGNVWTTVQQSELPNSNAVKPNPGVAVALPVLSKRYWRVLIDSLESNQRLSGFAEIQLLTPAWWGLKCTNVPCAENEYPERISSDPLDDRALCVTCPAGKYRPITPGFSPCLACPPIPVDDGPCKSCPLGQGRISGGPCQTCLMGRVAIEGGGRSCDVCPAGRFANATGTYVCHPCPVGTSTGGLAEQASCSECIAGSVASTIAQANCTLCSSGRSQAFAGRTSCIDCSPGSAMAHDGALACINCTVGSFVSTFGAKNCSLCSPGRSQPQEAQISCTPCSSGQMSNSTGASACLSCAAGSFVEQTGSTTCVQCQPGREQPLIGKTSCSNCTAGKASNGVGAVTCQRCIAGTFANQPETNFCQNCTAGRYQPGEEATVCFDCLSGSWSTPAAVECKKCEAGYAWKATIGCEQCEPGRASNQTGGTSCDACLAGKATLTPGSVVCDSCALGKAQILTGQSSCFDCEPGHISNVSGQTACHECEGRKVAETHGMTLCSQCIEGRFFLNASYCQLCVPGRYLTLPMESCELCSPGTASSEGARQCAACLAGRASLQGRSTCDICPSGTFSIATECSPCPGGYSSDPGSATCFPAAIVGVVVSLGICFCGGGVVFFFLRKRGRCQHPCARLAKYFSRRFSNNSALSQNLLSDSGNDKSKLAGSKSGEDWESRRICKAPSFDMETDFVAPSVDLDLLPPLAPWAAKPSAPVVAQNPSEDKNAGEKKGGAECIVCLDAPVEVVLVPCFHAKFCIACAKNLKQLDSKCPECRQDFTSFNRFYT